jgi:Cu-processing system permease protein
VIGVAIDLLREAGSRRWFFALAAGVTLLLGGTALALRLEVIDGALAATQLFGRDLGTDIRSVDVALRPLFGAVAYVVFYGGLLFGIAACADFGPALLAPGRIEHLLAQPIRRWELLAGTLLGVVGLAAAAALYGAGGFAMILWYKTGVWNGGALAAGLLGGVAFVPVYAVMLSVAVFVRSAAFSALSGVGVGVLGVLAGFRAAVAEAIGPGWLQALFGVLVAPVPRVSTMAIRASDVAMAVGVEAGELSRLVGGALLFGGAALACGIWRFERKDF